MLFACLILGCSISSFAYRRQDGDKYQTPIFAVAIASATIFGLAMGVNANVIMLGIIPWALCLAMIGSVTVHWLIRRCSKNAGFSTLRSIAAIKARKKHQPPKHNRAEAVGTGAGVAYIAVPQAD
jgi:hypothetical protein